MVFVLRKFSKVMEGTKTLKTYVKACLICMADSHKNAIKKTRLEYHWRLDLLNGHFILLLCYRELIQTIGCAAVVNNAHKMCLHLTQNVSFTWSTFDSVFQTDWNNKMNKPEYISSYVGPLGTSWKMKWIQYGTWQRRCFGFVVEVITHWIAVSLMSFTFNPFNQNKWWFNDSKQRRNICQKTWFKNSKMKNIHGWKCFRLMIAIIDSLFVWTKSMAKEYFVQVLHERWM